jgi:hypothetical protein
VTNFWEHDATGQPLAAVDVQQANAPGGRRGHAAPGQVGHEFVAGGEPDVLLYKHISREPTGSEILERSFVSEQSIGVKLDSGLKGAELVVASSWRFMAGLRARANDASHGRKYTFVQTVYSVSEGKLLDLLDERNRVAANLATEAHETRGTGENHQVGSAAVRVEWTPADERGAGTTKLNAVALDDVGNRMLLTDRSVSMRSAVD